MGSARVDRRSLPVAPILASDAETLIAYGIAQIGPSAPQFLHQSPYWPIPRGATIGIYGSAMDFQTTSVIISVGLSSWEVPANVWSQMIPGLRMVTFTLPDEIAGEVWVVARSQRPPYDREPSPSFPCAA